MINLTTVENALKSVYLDVVSNQLNSVVNPLFSKIKQTTKDVWGKEIIRIMPDCSQYKTDLKTLKFDVEISDKAIRASQNNANALVNLINDEMENLINKGNISLSKNLFNKDNKEMLNGIPYWFETNLCKTLECKFDYSTFINIITENDFDMIVCSYKTKRQFVDMLEQRKQNIDVIELGSGHKAVSFGGVPIVSFSNDFIIDDEIYFLNTRDIALNQLCDWLWLDDVNGTILKQVPNKPVYKATLIKYCNLTLDRFERQLKVVLKGEE